MLKQLENIQIPMPGELDLDLNNIAAISDAVKRNFTALHISVSAGGGEDLAGVSASSAVMPSGSDPEYEQFLADVWVGVVLTLMVLSCVCCMCSCLLYHKFQQWKRSVIESREATDIESARQDAESLPSYTIASGLPSYEEALEQLRTVKAHLSAYANGTGGTITSATHDDHHLHPHHLHHRKSVDVVAWLPTTPPTPRIGGGGVTSLTVTNLFQIYRRNSLNSAMNGEGTKPDS